MNLKKIAGRGAAAAVLAVALVGGGAAAANAATQVMPTFGGGYEGWVNAGATADNYTHNVAIGNPTSWPSVDYPFSTGVSFTAPEHTTYTSANVEWQTYDGTGYSPIQSVASCTLSADKTVITCPESPYVMPGMPADGVNNPAIYFFAPGVAAAADAPGGTYTTYATLTPNDPLMTGGTTTSTMTIIPAADTPMIDPVVGASAAGVGVLGAAAFFIMRRRSATSAS
ncbi:hypothetical protein ACTU6V_00860 [Microbacterium sp. A204]|uniref:hypothetical protein n=1 Tax=Microbacterium sp. A204 TaxID=3457321 RepID=UPI003FD1B11A